MSTPGSSSALDPEAEEVVNGKEEQASTALSGCGFIMCDTNVIAADGPRSAASPGVGDDTKEEEEEGGEEERGEEAPMWDWARFVTSSINFPSR